MEQWIIGILYLVLGVMIFALFSFVLIALYALAEWVLSHFVDNPPLWAVILAMVLAVLLIIFVPYGVGELVARLEFGL